MIKNRYKTIISKQKKLYPHIKSDEQLIRFYGESTPAQPVPKSEEKEVQMQTDIKSEHKSEQLPSERASSSDHESNS